MKRPYWLHLAGYRETLAKRRAEIATARLELRQLERGHAADDEIEQVRARLRDLRRDLRCDLLRPRRACLRIRDAVESYDDEQQRLRAALDAAGDAGVDAGHETEPPRWLTLPVTGRIGAGLFSHLGRLHPGLDISAPAGTPVRAAARGRVVVAEEFGGYGKLVCIRHSGDLVTCYAHQSEIAVAAGARVQRGEPIGYVGSTGRSAGDHLHFEVRVGGKPVDPLERLRLPGSEPTIARGGASTPAGGWRPLLEGAAADRAEASIEEIAAALEAFLDLPAERDYSLANGKTGIALFYSYLARAGGDERHRETGRRLLAESAEALERITMDASLLGGFTGIAWASSHLATSDYEPGEDPWSEIDLVLRDYLARSPWRSDYDLVGGLAGHAVYALDRLPGVLAWELLECGIDRLEETAERDGDGARWHTAPELMPPHQLEVCPEGYYNLGLAHGAPGPIGVLGAACSTPARERARPLLDEAVRWLLAQRLDHADGSFPAFVCKGAPREPGRLAWCYGDPGAAAALMSAARAAGNPAWEREALEVARGAVRRPPEDAGVVDPGLCHGAAGLGHIFNRLYHNTGDEELGRAARFWIERALDMKEPGSGVAGFSALVPDGSGSLHSHPDPGLLTGAAGIGVALLAATTDVEPSWDRFLLLSPPGPSAPNA